MKPISKMDWDIIDARVTKACDRHKFQKRMVGFLALLQTLPGGPISTFSLAEGMSHERFQRTPFHG